jgi:hypothetical protein
MIPTLEYLPVLSRALDRGARNGRSVLSRAPYQLPSYKSHTLCHALAPLRPLALSRAGLWPALRAPISLRACRTEVRGHNSAVRGMMTPAAAVHLLTVLGEENTCTRVDFEA